MWSGAVINKKEKLRKKNAPVGRFWFSIMVQNFLESFFLATIDSAPHIFIVFFDHKQNNPKNCHLQMSSPALVYHKDQRPV